MGYNRALGMIYLGIPTHAGLVDYRLRSALKHFERDFPVNAIEFRSLSLLALNFNTLLAGALNDRKMGVTHFLLLHDDVVPQAEHWARTLMTELVENKLDVIAATISLRNDSGDCSTSVEAGAGEPERYSVNDLSGLTVTSRQEPGLLINSGMLLIDVTRPWVESFWFQTHDEIRRRPNGLFEAHCISEDFLMSRWLAKRDIPFGATGKVKALHVGRKAWPNWVEAAEPA